jgi:hypothetical protein
MSNWRRRLLVAALSAVLVVPGGIASAFWTTGSGAGGNGASAATSVGRGATPTATVSGGAVTVTWEPSSLGSGAAVTGYRVERYDDASLTAQTLLTSCAGRNTATTCTEHDVPSGRWRYSVTPLIGTSWAGAESAMSDVVSTDTTAPLNAISISDVTGDAARTDETIYYRGLAPGSFTLTDTLTDTGSGPASSRTSALTDPSSGWTHAPSTTSTPTGGPYVSGVFSWIAGTTGTVGETVHGRDLAGNESAVTLSLVEDSKPPTGATVTYPHGYQPARSVVVTLGPGSDAGSGVASRQLQRSDSSITAGTCGVQNGFSDLGPVDPASPYVDDTVTDGSCYRYRYVVTDRVGNQTTAVSANVAKVDSSYGGPALRSVADYSVLGGTGVTSTLVTRVSGDLGLSTSGLIAGFPPGIVGGDIDDKNAAAVQAQVDLGLAYTDAASRTPTTFFAGDQIDATFHPGVHHTSGAFANTGTMTLDADGDPDATFVFQIDAAMGPAAGSQVVLVDGALASHVYWQVNGAVTVGANAFIVGTLMARGAVTLGDSVVLIGRALATGAVTMAANTIRFSTALPPIVTIDGAGPGGSTDVTKDTAPTLAGTSDATPGTPVTVTVAGQVLTTQVLADGTWGVTASPLTAGDHTVVAAVLDAAGNHGSATQRLTVEVSPAPVDLAGATSFSVLGGTAVSSTGPTSVSGDLGLSPFGLVTGFSSGLVGGDIHDKDSAASLARAGLQAAYDELDARTPHQSVVGDLGGQTFHAGIYHSTAALSLTGTVTLDAENDPSAIFIFQGDAALDTAASARVVLAGGAQPRNVYWQIEGAVGTGASSTLTGTILSAGAITLGDGTQLTGRALSLAAVVVTASTVRFTIAPPPALTIDGDTPDGATALTGDSTPEITGTTDAGAGRPLTVTVGDQSLSTTVAPDGSWAVTAAMLPAGTHQVVASVRDLDGNGGRATQSLTVEVNPAPVSLGSGAAYSVLSGTSIVNTGVATHLGGSAGVSPAGTIAGLAPGDVDGTMEDNTVASALALADAGAAYDDLEGRAPHQHLTGVLGGRTFRAGIYHSVAALDLTGTMTLDGQDLPGQVFIFQGDAAMTTAALAEIRLVGGAQAADVYFQVAGAVSTGAGSVLRGSVLARGATTIGAGSRIVGRAFSWGTITLADTTVERP